MSLIPYPLTVQFGPDLTGQAGNLVVTAATDAAGNAVSLGSLSWAEEEDAAGNATTGVYAATVPLDTAWAYPLRVSVGITGQAGVVAALVLDRPAPAPTVVSSVPAPANGITFTASASGLLAVPNLTGDASLSLTLTSDDGTVRDLGAGTPDANDTPEDLSEPPGDLGTLYTPDSFTWQLPSGLSGSFTATITGAAGVSITARVIIGESLTYYDFGDGLPTSSLLLTQAPWSPGDFVFVAISAAEDGDGNAITGSGLLALTPAFVFRDDGGAATDPIPGDVVEIGGTYYARCQPDTVQPSGARWPAACVTVEVGGVRVGALEVWG